MRVDFHRDGGAESVCAAVGGVLLILDRCTVSANAP